MILAYHVILSAYGFWLPNDPRGSWSTYVGSRKLHHFGPATKTTTRKSIAHTSHNHALRLAAKSALNHPPVIFDGLQARAIALAMGDFIQKNNLTCYAFAIMPDHLHLALARHTYPVEKMANLLKGAATTSLLKENLHPFQAQHSPRKKIPHAFAQDGWYVFLDSPSDIHRAITYVNNNPMRSGHKPQHWNFITPYPHLKKV